MEESIRSFAKQFSFEPEIKNEDKLKPAQNFVLAGMGGSHLAADLINNIDERLEIKIHSNYGLPYIKESEKEQTLFIASSFSGNTEEVLDFLNLSIEKKLNIAVISKGGKLIEIAQEKNLPYIQLPESDIQPRMALGFSLLAISKLVKKDLIPALFEMTRTLNPLEPHDLGEELAEEMKDKIPVIYSSKKNEVIAKIWKIKFNETGKLPAFFNTIPELNHNEMTSFDYTNENQKLSNNFFFIFLKDPEDHPRVQKRMEITERLLEEKNLQTKTIEIQGEDMLKKMFNSLLLGDWVALHSARIYNSEPDQVPMVEKFKKLINQ